MEFSLFIYHLVVSFFLHSSSWNLTDASCLTLILVSANLIRGIVGINFETCNSLWYFTATLMMMMTMTMVRIVIFLGQKNRIGKKNTHTRTHAQSENGGNFVGGNKITTANVLGWWLCSAFEGRITRTRMFFACVRTFVFSGCHYPATANPGLKALGCCRFAKSPIAAIDVVVIAIVVSRATSSN